MWDRLAAAIRNAFIWLLNVIVALFGTAVIETPISQAFHPHSISQFLTKTYSLSSLIAFALGFLVFRQWKPAMAKWVGIGGICWFFIGAMLTVDRSTLWLQMSGTACAYGMRAPGCLNWFVFTLPAVRTIGNSDISGGRGTLGGQMSE